MLALARQLNRRMQLRAPPSLPQRSHRLGLAAARSELPVGSLDAPRSYKGKLLETGYPRDSLCAQEIPKRYRTGIATPGECRLLREMKDATTRRAPISMGQLR